MTAIHVDNLLAPLSEAAPAGADLGEGTELFVLESEARGKPEQQYGDKIIPAVAPNWIEVRDQAQVLLKTTHDLRVLLLLMRAATRLEGLEGYHAGLKVLRGWIDTQWEHLHPLLDASDDNDPMQRLNVLAALADREHLLADLRAARLGSDRVGCTVQEVEQAFLLRPEAESQAERHSLRQRIRDSGKAAPALATALQGCAAELAAIEATLARRTPGRSPDFKPLGRILGVLDTIGRQMSGHAPADAPDGTAAGAASEAAGPRGRAATDAAVSIGGVCCRADAVRVLGKVCEWLEKNEPSHPAPLFIKRAQRLLDMGFMEIMQDLVPESVESVERLAGIPRG